MKIDLNHNSKIATVWLTRAERDDPAVQRNLDALYADCKAKKYMVAVYHSGARDLGQQTTGLLLYNRRRAAQCDGRRM